jgi:hypothetical protein
MLDRSAAAKALQKLFRRSLVADIDVLFDVLGTRSRMSVFRRLQEAGYRSSYTHSGRYYTLEGIPRFDERGLWFHQEVGFSRWGTLKATLVEWVEAAPVGFTHDELEGLLHLRVHNTLLGLVHEGKVGRTAFEGAYLYGSANPARAAEQRAKRAEGPEEWGAALALPPATVIEVLVEALQAGRVRVSSALVATRLRARGISVSVEQVEEVLGQYGVESVKKTARVSKRSRV